MNENASADPTQSNEAPPIGMFLMLVVLVAGFLAFYYMRPSRRALEESAATSAPTQTEQDKMRAWSDRMRQEYIEQFGQTPASGMSINDIQAQLQGKLNSMGADGSMPQEQREQLENMLKNMPGLGS